MDKSKFEKFFLPKPVVLIGMMGAGKSSVGRALAELLTIPYIDSDHEIEAAAQCSVAQIFADYGEDEFRRIERQVIARLLGSVSVLSVGGGAFIDPETRIRIKQQALSVWMQVDRAVLLARVLRHGSRPLLKGGDPKEKLEQILNAREPIYGEADLTVFCDDKPIAHNARQVAEAIKTSLASKQMGSPSSPV